MTAARHSRRIGAAAATTLAVVFALAFASVAGRSAAVRADACALSLQELIDRARPGSIVSVPPCVYREVVVVRKPLTLWAQPGAQIRGSDVWRNGWRRHGRLWERGRVPRFMAHGLCRAGTTRCLWPAQAFYDGRPLLQVRGIPDVGEFAVDAERNVVLADDPTAGLVEVTVRTRWIITRADDVTIRGFTMRHSAIFAQEGALSNFGHDGWTLRDNVLSDAHGAVVRVTGGTGVVLDGNDISHGGSVGVSATDTSLLVLRGNRVHDNNTELFQENWESGGVKITHGVRPIAHENEIWGNQGPGLWCDSRCEDAIFAANRVHGNAGPGIFWEISVGARIARNVVWENGRGWSDWGWGAGILVASSANADVASNVAAWNADGIVVLSQDRRAERGPAAIGNVVQDNIVLARDDPTDPSHAYGVAWLQDWPGGLFHPASGNRGAHNRYWYGAPETASTRFAWDRSLTRLTDFNATPGEEGGQYLSRREQTTFVDAWDLPRLP